MRFLTAKPVIYVANVDEDGLQNGNRYLESVREIAAADGALLVTVCAELEQELASLSDEERADYLGVYGLTGSSLERLISECYRLLGLISYFTFNEKESDLEIGAEDVQHAAESCNNSMASSPSAPSVFERIRPQASKRCLLQVEAALFVRNDVVCLF